jgi:hypothetical protein
MSSEKNIDSINLKKEKREEYDKETSKTTLL